MQLAVRLAATLLALTWITPVAQAAAARRAVDQQVAKGVDFIKLWVDDEFGDLPLRMPAEIGKAIIDQAHEHKLRAIAHIFYLDNAKTLVSQRVDEFAHSVRDQPVIAGCCALAIVSSANAEGFASVIAYLKQQTGQ